LTNNTANSNSWYRIYSYNSTSTINDNVVCGNANLDFNSSNWQPSYGDNNKCSKFDGWNDKNTTGCKFSCNCINFDFDNDNKVDIFDVVAGLEHLSEGKGIFNKVCSARNHNEINLIDLLTLISKIVIEK